MKKVVMFPGQGSQRKGMGKELFPKYRSLTKSASEILGYDLEELCVSDPGRNLIKTQYTQPAVFVVNHLHYLENKPAADYLIGHSLGEYNALLAAGAFDFKTGLKLVQKRGQLMGDSREGSMVAILGISSDELKNALNDGGHFSIEISNFNTPTQIIVSGPTGDLKKLITDFGARKIKAIPLAVGAAFHSSLMQPATDQFASFLQSFSFNPLSVPVISNYTALPYPENSVAQYLSQQIRKPVLWNDSITYLLHNGAEEFAELGSDILTKMYHEIKKHTNITSPQNGSGKNTGTSADTSRKEPPAFDSHAASNGNGYGKASIARYLGSSRFREDYGLTYSYVTGSMYKGIASKEMVVRIAKAGMLSFFGTAGLKLNEIEAAIDYIQSRLINNETYGLNLIHHLFNPQFEIETVNLYLKRKIKIIEASAFMQMTDSLVYFHVMGLKKAADGTVVKEHRILAKISRPEVAEVFMRPPSKKILTKLIEKRMITEEQAALAENLPISNDICVEADSGGHTDGGVSLVLLPSIQSLRERIQQEYAYKDPIRIGLGGGIGTPQSAASAFIMGADFIMTGSINQCTVESGSSDAVKDLLQDINVQDTAYAPAGDMFEIGARVQVLKKGVLFPARANKLYELYHQYNAVEEIPANIMANLEKYYFKKPVSEVWNDTKAYLAGKGKTAEIDKASKNPKQKMALIFKWYFAYSSRAALSGDKDNLVNFQVHTGPALGAFNQWVKGSPLENWRNRHVDEIGINLMNGTAELMEKASENVIQYKTKN